LINPNGILFGQGAQVNVGGLVASTLDLNDASLSGNTRVFSGNGTGSIINQGSINAVGSGTGADGAKGGYVALLGHTVSNQGSISAPLGTVALGAGSAATLTFQGNSLVKMQVDQSVLNSLADNGGLIRADGGMVIMNAGAKNALLASVVNNTGVIEARTVQTHEGSITLLGGMAAGTVNVGGTLDASAPNGGNGGNGGFIETSAARVRVADDAKITTAAPTGKSGTWLIDPTDYTIAAVDPGNGSSYMSNSTLSTSLGSGNVTIQTLSATSGNGDIYVNGAVAWSVNNTLTLNAHRNININQSITSTGATGKLALPYGQGAVAANNTASVNVNASVNLAAGPNFSTLLGNDGGVKSFTVITALGAAGSSTATDLQGMSGGLTNNYALGSNIDATTTSGWNSGAGFAPIGNSSNRFTGRFDGLGHTISNLTINRPDTDYVGLFSFVDSGAVSNVGLVGGSVAGNNFVGGLVGISESSTISNSYATGAVTGSGGVVGGLVGYNNTSTISNSYATGAVTGSGGAVGGLVGSSDYGSTISNSYATGAVTGGGYFVGGLAGYNDGTISNSYAAGAVSGSDDYVGGLVGYNDEGTISTSYATGNVTGADSVGGLVGYNFGGTISNSFWDVQTSGLSMSAGGLGMSTAQMQQQLNFTSATTANGNANPGWDFANTWRMYDGHTYPLLQSFLKPLTITANSASQVYNGVPYSGGNGISCSAGVCSDADSHLFNTAGFTGSSQGATGVGSYTLTSDAYSDQQGYNIRVLDGTLAIDQRPINISADSGQTKVYGSTDPTLTFTAETNSVGRGLIVGDTFSGALTRTAGDSVAAGPYAISQGTLANSNYAITYAGANFAIRPAPAPAPAPATSPLSYRLEEMTEMVDRKKPAMPSNSGLDALLQIVGGGVRLPAAAY
jgi:large exoprotein involved in heme utilization and adhesion